MPKQCQAQEAIDFMCAKGGSCFWLSNWVDVQCYDEGDCRRGVKSALWPWPVQMPETTLEVALSKGFIHFLGFISTDATDPQNVPAAQIFLLNYRFTKLTANMIPSNSASIKLNCLQESDLRCWIARNTPSI